MAECKKIVGEEREVRGRARVIFERALALGLQSGRLGDDAGRVGIPRLHRLRLWTLPFAEIGVSNPVCHLVLLRQDQAVTDAVTEDGAFCGKENNGQSD